MTGTLIPAYTRGEQRSVNPEHQRLCNQLRTLKGKPGRGAEVRAIIKARRKLPSKIPDDPEYRRLWYVRYADDFLLGSIGTRKEAEEIKANLKIWLWEQRRLVLSEKKTLITHATDTAARFLGYEIVNQQSHHKCTHGARSANGRIALRVPATVIAKKCQPYLRNGKPIHRPERIANSAFSIVADYCQ